MENKLYYKDAYIQSFSARPLKQEQDEAGNWYLVVNQTAFYPTGGGQPHDTGMLGNQKVVNVEEIDGEVRHYLESPLDDINKEINGVIDWERRFDHMQQHAGQHILSAAFDNLFQYKTVGFHLGNEILTIDLDTETLSLEEANEAEEHANRIIIENRPIETRWITEEELSEFPLRKETKVKEDIRLVMIPDYDYNGCGGTHPKATGEVRAIKILDWERQKKKTRIQFVCGDRVLSQFDRKQSVLLELTKLLNAPEQEMEQAVVRLLNNGKVLEKELEKAREGLVQYEARELIEKNSKPIISEIFQNRTIQELQKLARLITAEKADALVLFVSENDNRLQLVCARGAERLENMKNVMVQALSLINGKGGGNDSFAQGGGDTIIFGEQMIRHLLEIVTENNKI